MDKDRDKKDRESEEKAEGRAGGKPPRGTKHSGSSTRRNVAGHGNAPKRPGKGGPGGSSRGSNT